MNEHSPGVSPDDSVIPETSESSEPSAMIEVAASSEPLVSPETPATSEESALTESPAFPETYVSPEEPLPLEPVLSTQKAPIPIRVEENANPVAEPVQASPQEKPAHPSGSHPGWLALILIGLASSCLAVFLTLAILGAANQGLSYASPADVSAVQSQINTLQTQVDSLEQDIAGLRARVDELEVLAARTTELEKMALNLQAEIDKRVSEAQQLQDSVAGIQSSITDVVAQSKAFQSFMDGLRGLVNKINPGGQNP